MTSCHQVKSEPKATRSSIRGKNGKAQEKSERGKRKKGEKKGVPILEGGWKRGALQKGGKKKSGLHSKSRGDADFWEGGRCTRGEQGESRTQKCRGSEKRVKLEQFKTGKLKTAGGVGGRRGEKTTKQKTRTGIKERK